MKILSAVYSHPDFFPPTLNALHELEKHFEVFSLSRNVSKSTSISKKVKSYTVGEYMDIRNIEKISTFAKITLFFKYCLKMRRIIVREKIDIILLYDNIPFLAYWLVQKTIFKRKYLVWYHNHDVLEIDKVRKYSIQWFSGYFETKIFKKVNLFSLPTNERKQFFNLKYFKGDYFVIPNYPRESFYKKFNKSLFNPSNKVVKIIYQGELSKNHGFEELIEVLSIYDKYVLEFHLIGYIKEDYKQFLLDFAQKNKSMDRFFLHERVDFEILPNFTNKHHIGWAVHKPVNIQYKTGSSASNKIYEYIAVGLPVILYDTKHYRKSLNKFEWASFTSLSKKSIIQNIDDVINKYRYKSQKAILYFGNELNYEVNFAKIIKYLKNIKGENK